MSSLPISIAQLRLTSKLIRGEQVFPSEWPTEHELDQYLSAVDAHGMGPLLFESLHHASHADDLPLVATERLQKMARSWAVQDALGDQALRTVLIAFHDQGIKPLLIKGAVLAKTHYPRSELRPRDDTDLVVPREQLEQTAAILARLGYQPLPHIDGELILRQVAFRRIGRYGIDNTMDVHWALSSRPKYANLLRYQDMYGRGRPVPELGRNARAPCPVDSLLLACIHRVAGHADDARMLWLYDVHLLVGALTMAEVADFVDRALRENLGDIAFECLHSAQLLFTTELPENIDALSPGRQAEATLTRNVCLPDIRPGGFGNLCEDFMALPGWGARTQWPRQHAFPHPAYMLAKYRVKSPAWLPALYLHRGVCGAIKTLRRPKASN